MYLQLIKQLEKNFKISPTLIVTFITSLLISMIVYGFELTHFTLSVDEAIWPDHDYSMSLAIGRWMFVFLKYYVFPNPYIPFFTTFISLILLAIAAVIIVNALKLTLSQSIVFVAFFIGLPQFAYQLEYNIQSETVALGLIFTACSFYFFIARHEYSKKLIYPLVIIGFVFALAIYQSLLLVPIALYLTKIIFDLEDTTITYKTICKEACLFGLLMVIAAVLYFIITKLIMYLGDIAPITYSQQFISWNTNIESSLSTFMSLVKKYLNRPFYPYGLGWYAVTIIPLAWLTYVAFYKRSIRNTLIVITSILLFSSPFWLCFAFLKLQPARTLLSLSVAMALLFVIFLRNTNAIKITSIIASFIVIAGIASASKLFYIDYVTYETDKAIANRIYYSIQEKYPKLSIAGTPVYFRAPYFYENFWKIPNGETFGASHFNIDGENSTIRIVQLFKVANIAEIRTPNKEVIKKLDKLCLPSWPNKESIQMIDGVLVVNLRKDLVRKPGQICNAP